MNVVRQKNGSYELRGDILNGDDENIKTLRGYFGVGMYEPQNAANVGSIWRSALGVNADFLCTIGGTYRRQKSDTTAAHRHLPLWAFSTWEKFLDHAPNNIEVVAVDNNRSVRQPQSLFTFKHPKQALYLFGAESGGIHTNIIKSAKHYVFIPSFVCLNVACCATAVLYDRLQKGLS